MLVKQPVISKQKLYRENDHLWSFFYIFYTFFLSILKPCYNEQCYKEGCVYIYISDNIKGLTDFCLFIIMELRKMDKLKVDIKWDNAFFLCEHLLI